MGGGWEGGGGEGGRGDGRGWVRIGEIGLVLGRYIQA